MQSLLDCVIMKNRSNTILRRLRRESKASPHIRELHSASFSQQFWAENHRNLSETAADFIFGSLTSERLAAFGRTFVSSKSLFQWVTHTHLLPTLTTLSCPELKVGCSDEWKMQTDLWPPCCWLSHPWSRKWSRFGFASVWLQTRWVGCLGESLLDEVGLIIWISELWTLQNENKRVQNTSKRYVSAEVWSVWLLPLPLTCTCVR